MNRKQYMSVYLAAFFLISLIMTSPSPTTAAQTNALAQTTNPYLRLHATDPVHWRSWSDAAFDQARREGRPVLLSIGYLACHWCHVMQEESYANEEVAAYINAHFIPILVDREAQPDIDALYQRAAVEMGLPTGWPLTLFLTPDRAPFWGGAYFPQPARAGMPSFMNVLKTAAEAYQEDPAGLHQVAARTTQRLKILAANQPGVMNVKKSITAGHALAQRLDPLQGGFGEGAKFPSIPALRLIWRSAIATSDAEQINMVHLTLRHMVQGGLFDHVGGGFYRYTVDPDWQVPHFEKMLDTNAEILSLLIEVWRETRDPILRARTRATVAFLLTEMRLDDGTFATALDADSLDAQGTLQEGTFYLWPAKKIRTLAGPHAEVFFETFALGEPEGGIPFGPGVLYRTDLEGAGLSADLQAVLAKLKESREARPRPRRDEKVLADWNAMTIMALAEAGATFNEPDWIAAAAQAYGQIQAQLINAKGGPFHAVYQGTANTRALLDDIAAMAQAALTLFEVTGKAAYLTDAQALSDRTKAYADPTEGGYFLNPVGQNAGAVALKPRFDEPNPSANARMAAMLAKLALLTGSPKDAKQARMTQDAFGALADRPNNFGFSAALLSVPLMLDDAVQVAIIAKLDDPNAQALIDETFAKALPARALLRVRPGADLPQGHPAQYKEQIDGLATAYVCRGTVCSLPVTQANDLADVLNAMRGVEYTTAILP